MVCTYNGISFSSKILILAITWMKHESIMFSEINQQERTNVIDFQLYELSRIDRFIETESRRWWLQVLVGWKE